MSLDLLATLAGRRDERLIDPDTIKEWLVRHGLVETNHRMGGEDLRRTQRFRAALLAIVEAELSGQRPTRAAISAINEAAAVPERAPRLRLGPHGLHRERAQPRCSEILGIIARDAIELLTGPQRELLRECAAEDCRGIYLDTSPGRSRRWCSAARCGNRARVAAHRARRLVAVDEARA